MGNNNKQFYFAVTVIAHFFSNSFVVTSNDQTNLNSESNVISPQSTSIELDSMSQISKSKEKVSRLQCSSNKLVVKGIDIKMSDVLKETCIDKVNFIEIFALDKFTIDVDIDKSGQKVQLAIIAPVWEVIGNRKIILNGSPADAHSTSQALDSVGDGRHGKPGKPGNAAGSFFGVGKAFINDINLKIYMNGGRGGPGQDGGKGSKFLSMNIALKYNKYSVQILIIFVFTAFIFFNCRSLSVDRFFKNTNHLIKSYMSR